MRGTKRNSKHLGKAARQISQQASPPDTRSAVGNRIAGNLGDGCPQIKPGPVKRLGAFREGGYDNLSDPQIEQ